MNVVRIAFLLFLFLNPKNLPAADAFIPPMPEDLDQTEFYLQTVGVGDALYMAFGHTMIRIQDKKSGLELVYNWGVFDFADPLFLPNFATGRLNYRLAIFRMSQVERIYRYERRTLFEDRLNLTRQQKETLMRRIIWNAAPENIYYHYHYYANNCSTKVRDYLDEALNGVVSKAYKEQLGPQTLRESIQEHFLAHPMTGMATDIFMNDELDVVMSPWEEMYLPARLTRYLRELPAVDDTGSPTGEKLLVDRRVYYEYEDPKAAVISGYQLVFFILLFPLLWAGMFFVKAGDAAGKHPFRFLGLGSLMWGIFSGGFGSVMVFFWALSLHYQMYHSATLWLFWPTDLILVWLGIGWMRRGTALSAESFLGRWMRPYCLLHFAGMVVFSVMHLCGIFGQDVTNSFVYLLPLGLTNYAFMWRWGVAK